MACLGTLLCSLLAGDQELHVLYNFSQVDMKMITTPTIRLLSRSDEVDSLWGVLQKRLGWLPWEVTELVPV